jgi:hypothetical protein
MDNTYLMDMPGFPPVKTAQDSQKEQGAYFWFWWVVVFLWVVLGIVAFFLSIICFGKSGTLGYQIVGFLLALFFGPLYFIYYLSVDKYCR